MPTFKIPILNLNTVHAFTNILQTCDTQLTTFIRIRVKYNRTSSPYVLPQPEGDLPCVESINGFQ